MILVPCHRPSGSLEPAPLTTFVVPEADEQWAAFWDDAGRYVLRRNLGGAEGWYGITAMRDVPPEAESEDDGVVDLTSYRTRLPHGLARRPRGERVTVLVGKYGARCFRGRLRAAGS